MNLTFSPGPSKVEPAVRQWLTDAYDAGILQMGHRSERYTQLQKQTVELLKTKLGIPQEYAVYFVSSATESWEIIAQSLTRARSLHFYNGSFGERWFQIAKLLRPDTVAQPFGIQEALDARGLPDPAGVDVVCVTQNETSTATQVDGTVLQRVANHYRDALLCVDATSSLGGLHLRYARADVWFASVQKCLGLPAGLGLLICGPRAVDRIKELAEKHHYNSALALHEKALNHQTTHTPNVLGIYLLNRLLEARPPIKQVQDHLSARATMLYQFFEESLPNLPLLIADKALRSVTVLGVEATGARLDDVKKHAQAHGIQLGNGYGPLAKTSFRIANFPQHTDPDFVQLQKALLTFGG